MENKSTFHKQRQRYTQKKTKIYSHEYISIQNPNKTLKALYNNKKKTWRPKYFYKFPLQPTLYLPTNPNKQGLGTKLAPDYMHKLVICWGSWFRWHIIRITTINWSLHKGVPSVEYYTTASANSSTKSIWLWWWHPIFCDGIWWQNTCHCQLIRE